MLHDKDKYSKQSKGVKPKNRVYCPDCRRQKMKFDSEKEAQNFIKWNKENFDEKVPTRIYWCDACCGFHITARPMGGVGVAINMKLPYLTEALEKDRNRVMHAVKTIYHVLGILKQPSGYYGKIGLGRCKSLLDSLNHSKNPYYEKEREELYAVVEQQRAEHKDMWMKKKYCKLIKTKLYRALCDIEHDPQSVLKRYNYDLTYILHLAEKDEYDLNDLPELFLDEWETLFQASAINEFTDNKMTINNQHQDADRSESKDN